MEEYVITSKTSVFHRLGTKGKLLSERRMLEHENQDSCDGTNEKEIHSVFPSRMKRKVELSITANSSLKVKRSTIVVTDSFKPRKRMIKPSQSSCEVIWRIQT